MSEVCIIGLGPWGLSCLERLVDAARRPPGATVKVHIVDPNRPGGGLYAADEPDYFVLNTPCGQHSMYPYPAGPGEARLGLGFYEWARDRGYRWQGDQCRVADSGAPVSPDDFLPRRLMGEYLQWFYDVLVAEAPSNLSIVHHRTSAVDIVPGPGGGERVVLGDRRTLAVDHVVLTTGQAQEAPGGASPLAPALEGPDLSATIKAYPSARLVVATTPHQSVAVEGMGLVAIDVITALTVGLGGRYTAEPGGTLRYHPSGREPALYLFSRSGLPYCAKSLGAVDPMGDYQPAICTRATVEALKRNEHGGKRQMDARGELLPLVFAEMELCYYVCAARLEGGEDAARRVRQSLVDAWAAGAFDAARDAYASAYGSFRAASYFFVGDGACYADAGGYESAVYQTVHDDMVAALVPRGTSPVKAALETLRALRDIIRLAVEFKGLTLESHIDFQDHMRSRFARLIAGPPALRSQQLLALVDAGALRLPFGPAPEVQPLGDGRTRVRSTHLGRPFEVVVDRLVRAHIDPPSLTGPTSALLANLARAGRARPLSFDGTPVGSIDLTEDFHPVNAQGGPERRLWVFGVLTEGARYFTLYIPSPKSRVRAFADAAIFAHAVVAGATTVRPRPNGYHRPRQYAPARYEQTPLRAAPLRVALVNNMPDGAFAETEQQLVRLLGAGPGDGGTGTGPGVGTAGGIELERFTLPGIARGPEVGALISAGYRELGALWSSPPDALVVTGAAPTTADLASELYWPGLKRLMWWARSVVPTMVLSCLSAHAALLSFDNLNRRLLLEKCSGVFEHTWDAHHPLTAGIDDAALPHSRFNEVGEEEVARAGYRVLARSDGAGWAVAVGDKGQCEVLLLQGHPEYTPLTLLREYRRDVRKYISGSQGSYPHVPNGYLSADGVAALAEFQAEVVSGRPGPEVMEHFPYQVAAANVVAGWDGAASQLMANWAQSARRRLGLAPIDLDALGPGGAATGPSCRTMPTWSAARPGPGA